MEPVISVIIPVYNTEQYLHKCIDSVRGQTLREIEIILVDDGSPDNCGKICDEYAAQDSRIRVIHQENRGLSAARNVGIEAAQADVIGFVDSDDWIEPDMFALLYQNMAKENADISVCGMYIHKNNSITLRGDLTYTVQNSREAIRSLFQLSGVGVAAWNKLYRRQMYNTIRFPEGRIYEDAFIMVQLMDTANTVVFDMQPKYHYIRRKGSITMHSYRAESHDKIDAAYYNYKYISQKYPDLADLGWYGWALAQFSVLISMFAFHGVVDQEKERELICFLKENRKAIWANPLFPLKRKLLLIVLCISKPLCKLLVKILKHKSAL